MDKETESNCTFPMHTCQLVHLLFFLGSNLQTPNQDNMNIPHLFYRILIGLTVWITLPVSQQAQELHSPDKALHLILSLTSSGQPAYTLTYKKNLILHESRLGLITKEAELSQGFHLTDTTYMTHDETWTPVWGEYAHVRNHYNELTVTYAQDNGNQMRIRFRLFNDGLGFRYELPTQPHLNYLTLMDEKSEFHFPADYTLYGIPGDYDTDEYLYVTAPISRIAAPLHLRRGNHSESHSIKSLSVQTPLLIKSSNEHLYINIHEAALVGYPAMALEVDTTAFNLKAHLTPDVHGVAAYLQLPFHTPWRTIIVCDDARNLLASQLIYNLNEPCALIDVSWIKPQKFIGVWWEMFIGKQRTWAYSNNFRAKPGVTDYQNLTPNEHHPANTANVKKYIDFAAENGIASVLVEGWNEGWEDWASYHKNRQFLFNKPYPDFNVDSLQQYAAQRGVHLIMHHETGANAADYERQLDRAFQYMIDHGYNTVKTGYVGSIIPRSEHHSSQWMVDHYLYVTQRAADYHIMVDSHEAVRPTGLCRTYPNWLAQESARGGEFEAMGGNPPEHTCLLPFTRLKGGPMDYTPGLFETCLSYYNEGKSGQAGTTLARQLALYLTMPSPLQMACDLPENYRRFADAFQFIKDVPVDWADSHYLEAEPGDYITVARLDKHSADWYVGGITNEHPRTAVIDFSFLPKGQNYKATIYADAPNADWKTNPQAYRITEKTINSKSRLKVHLAAGGGFAIRLIPRSSLATPHKEQKITY